MSVVLPEGNDERIIQAARKLKDEDAAQPIVLGKPEQVEAAILKPPSKHLTVLPAKRKEVNNGKEGKFGRYGTVDNAARDHQREGSGRD